MRRLIGIVLLLTLLWAAPSHAALTFFWACESTTLASGTTDFSPDTSATGGGTSPSITAGAAIIGTNGCEFNNATGGEHYRFSNAGHQIVSNTAGSIALGFNMATRAANGTLFYIQGASSGNDHIQIFTTATDELKCQIKSNNGGTPVTASATTTAFNFSLSTTYWVTCGWDVGANQIKICVYDNTGAQLDTTCRTGSGLVAPTDLTLSDAFRIGETSGASQTENIDNIFVWDTLAGADSCFLSNRTITAYSSYTCGSSVVPRGMLLGVYP